ncbi:hypothetical protein VTN96DRAFT_5622 [Rasamsonia emersonii]
MKRHNSRFGKTKKERGGPTWRFIAGKERWRCLGSMKATYEDGRNDRNALCSAPGRQAVAALWWATYVPPDTVCKINDSFLRRTLQWTGVAWPSHSPDARGLGAAKMTASSCSQNGKGNSQKISGEAAFT